MTFLSVLQKSNPELEKAIKFSRDFYDLCIEEKPPSSALEHYLDASVRNNQLPKEVLSWYNNVHWANLLLEDLSLGKPAISPALQGLRRYMYTLVKECGHANVTEYGRTSTENFHVAEVCHGWQPCFQVHLSPVTPLSPRRGGRGRGRRGGLKAYPP